MVGFAVLTIAIVLCHCYLWKRLVGDTTHRRSTARRAGTSALVVLVALMVAAITLGTSVAPEIAQWFAWPGYLWLALFFYLLLALLVLELPRLALRPWVRRGRASDTVPAAEVVSPALSANVASPAATNEAAPPSAASEAAPPASRAEPEPGVPSTATSPAVSDSGARPRERPSGGRTVDRRVVLARGSALLAGAMATGLTGYGTTVAMGPPTVTQVPITVPRLDPRATGFRVALISDVHLGPIVGRSFTRRIVDLVNAEAVDAVAIAGDLVDGDVADLAHAAEPLADLRSTHGTFYVTGNHEYYVGYRQWVEFVPSLGMTPLRNERVAIEHNGGVFDLAGINDHTGYQWQDPGDVGAALAGRDPGRAAVLVAHQPVDVTEAVRHDVDLMLAGHTHGGQLSPFELAVSLQQGAVAGYYRFGDTQLYVTRGAGFWGPPVRVGAPPDITVVELRAGSAAR